MDLQDPTSKMSKSADSEAGCVYLTDTPDAILKKFKRAVTDSETEVRYDPVAKPGVSNLLDILGGATGQAPAGLADHYSRYGDLKTATAEAVIEVITPIQNRYNELLEDRAELARLLRIGADKARTVASATLQRTYNAIGMLPA
jgi:tryptophanyl-tRNA synthetase